MLTDHRAKPALSVAGTYRMIGLASSNLHRSGYSDVWIVEQHQSRSINDHLANDRPWDLDRTNGGLRVLPPFQSKDGEGFAEGNVDGIYRQADFIREYDPDLVRVIVDAGAHIASGRRIDGPQQLTTVDGSGREHT